MDPSVTSSEDHDPAVCAILERARRLTSEELVRLAHAYRTPDVVAVDGAKPIDRQRTLTLARRRAAKAVELRTVETAVAEALRSAGATSAYRPLRQLGILESAERAVADAVLAILLRDRLGEREALELRRPWESVA